MPAGSPLSTPLSHVLLALTIELDNEFEHRFAEAGGGARVTSLVMWSNFLRFVGDGITVGELPTAAGIPKSRTLSTLGGMERWRYVFVAPGSTKSPPKAKRDGYGSARGLRSEWVVRVTQAGGTAREIWRPLPGEIEERWRERFGADAIDEVRGSLESIAGRLDLELPEYLPIVGGTDGMKADVPPRERNKPRALHLAAHLSQVLLAYTLDFERESEVSLPLSADVVRALDKTGMAVRDLPEATGVSKEATSMALTFLVKTGYVVVEGATAATKVARLTPQGREVQEHAPGVHAAIEGSWKKRFGTDELRRLRAALEGVLAQRVELSRGLEPHPGGWRASKPYLEQTRAVIENPTARLPRYPMVLHRGGWPDGS
jgi:DNA-binding MarR family transcriptional regulator